MRRRLDRIYRENAPSREALAGNRFIRPIAHRVLAPELWRFTRRSVPRGVAVGLFVGILLLIPGIQIVGAALLAFPFRANIPIAAAMTFLSNPATTPFIVGFAIFIGNGLLGRTADMAGFSALVDSGAGIGEWAGWLLSEAAPALIAGLLVISTLSAVIGYLLAGWFWRARLANRWKGRSGRSGGTSGSPGGKL